MFEARRVLEVSAAGLAAERATGNDLAAIAEEVASLFATMDDPELFLVHDMQFHRAVAAACRNPILASLIEMVSTLFFEHRGPPRRAPRTGICATPQTCIDGSISPFADATRNRREA